MSSENVEGATKSGSFRSRSLKDIGASLQKSLSQTGLGLAPPPPAKDVDESLLENTDVVDVQLDIEPEQPSKPPTPPRQTARFALSGATRIAIAIPAFCIMCVIFAVVWSPGRAIRPRRDFPSLTRRFAPGRVTERGLGLRNFV